MNYLKSLMKKNDQDMDCDSNNQKKQCKNFNKCKGKGSTDVSRKSHRISKYCPLNETTPENLTIKKMLFEIFNKHSKIFKVILCFI